MLNAGLNIRHFFIPIHPMTLSHRMNKEYHQFINQIHPFPAPTSLPAKGTVMERLVGSLTRHFIYCA